MIYRIKADYANFGLDHVKGCKHECIYCTENQYHLALPYICDNVEKKLLEELPKIRLEIDEMRKCGYTANYHINMCLTTDPFPYEDRQTQKLSLKLKKHINDYLIPVRFLTKGTYPTSPWSYFNEDNLKLLDNNVNSYGITACLLSDKWHDKFEPFSAPILERINSLKSLPFSQKHTWLCMEPFPTPKVYDFNWDKEVVPLIDACSFVDDVWFGRLTHFSAARYLNGKESFYLTMAEKIKAEFEKRNSKIKFHLRKELKDFLE